MYVDPFSEIQTLSLYYHYTITDFSQYMDKNGNSSSDDIDVTWSTTSDENGATTEYYSIVDSIDSFCNGAEASEETYENVKDSIIKKENINYLKDALEKLNISLTYEFISSNDFIISGDFVKLTGIQYKTKPDVNISFMDKNIYSLDVISDFAPTTAQLTCVIGDYYIEFSIDNVPNNMKSAILYYTDFTNNNQNKVVLIINNIDKYKDGSNLKFYF